MRPPTDKSEMRGGVLGLAGFYRDFIKDLCGIAKPLNDLLAVHAGVPEEEMAVRSAHTPMHARWRLPQCCYSAIPRAKPHIIEHFSKVLAKAQRKVSIPVLECCYAIHHHGAAPQVPSVQHLRDALQDLCGTSGEPDVRDRKKILDRREQRMAMLNTAPNGRATP